jgi:hypothetical protein
MNCDLESRRALGFVVVCACWLFSSAGCRAPSAPSQATRMAAAPTIAAAVRAYEAYDLATSRALYRGVVGAADSSRVDRVTAFRALARYAWQFDGDLAAARGELEAARGIGEQASALWAQQARIELAARRVPEALASAERALATARGATDRIEADLLTGHVLLARGEPAALQRAASLLIAVLERRPGHAETSEALLGTALALDDGALVLEAWKSYFWIVDGGEVTPLLRAPLATLTALAPRWRGQPLGEADRLALALALGRSRWFRPAAQIARSLGAVGPELEALMAYQAFTERVAQVNADFYPRIARGLRDYSAAYDAAVHAAAIPLWAALEPGKPFAPEPFFALIRARFGAEGYLGTTVGFHGMLVGHVIQDEQRTIEQYGYSSEFRYALIDRPLSTDFTSWYGTTNVGGWGDASTMVQVRAAYTGEPFMRLAWVTDPDVRAVLIDQLARLRRDDLTLCAQDPYAPPASLANQLKLEASDRLHAQLVARGLRGRSLALAFVAESLRLNVEATVFAHEGRHALDQRHFPAEFAAMSDDERELRAKLSEVAFSSDPKLALTGSVIGARLDASTGHGRANQRFRRLIVDWMRDHGAEIAGLEPAVPLILQVNRLTNDQLRALVRSADPLATARR